MISCVVCGRGKTKEVSKTRVVNLLGREEPYEHRSFACASCGESFTNDEQGHSNEAARRKATARALSEIGSKEMRFLRELAGLTQTEFENALGLGRNTVARWETEQRSLPPYIKNMLRLVALNPTALLLLRDQDLVPSERTEAPLGGTIRATTPNKQYVRVGREVGASVLDDDDDSSLGDDAPTLANVIRLELPPPKKDPWKRRKVRSSLEHSG